jgi:hypothetical protein
MHTMKLLLVLLLRLVLGCSSSNQEVLQECWLAVWAMLRELCYWCSDF